MAQYTVGDFIKENRIQRGITQEALSEGICTPATLSKIENGAQTPSRGIYEALMQRLGKDDSLFSSYSSKKEMEKQELMFRLTRKVSYKEFDEIWDDYERLEKYVGKADKLEQQYLKYMKALIERYSGVEENVDITMQQLVDALYMTQSGFDVENPPKSKLLTFDEIHILNNIAILYKVKGNMSVALKILFYLKDYMEQNLVDIKEKGAHYPLVLSNLSRWLLKIGWLDEALKMILLAIDSSVQYGKMANFANMLMTKGDILDALERKEEAIETYRQTYYVALTIKDAKRIEKSMERLKEYNISIK